MIRTGLLATLTVALASSPTFAQYGGMVGVGGGSATIGAMRGGFGGGPVGAEMQRSVQVEMEGGEHLSGTIDLRPVIIDSDLGQYSVAPDKIKMIRFLKPEREAEGAGDADGGGVAVEKAVRRIGPIRVDRNGGMGGGLTGGGMRVVESDGRPAILTRGKVITTADREIIGNIHIPTDFRLELEFGSLNLAPGKLRTIAFAGDDNPDKPVPAEAANPHTPEDVRQAVPGEPTGTPRYVRHGRSLIVISPVGDQVTLFDLETKKSQSLGVVGVERRHARRGPDLLGKHRCAHAERIEDHPHRRRRYG